MPQINPFELKQVKIMPINRNLLEKLSAKPVIKPTGIGALPRSIHKTPGLREWVTLESVALPPVPVKREDNWGLISLLAVPTKLKDGIPGWFAPWGAVEWSLPTQQVVQKIDLRQREETATLRQVKTIAACPVNSNLPLDMSSRKQQENALFAILDRLFSNPNQSIDLASLASYYAGLFPAAIYRYYHSLIPESREWLRPDESAIENLGTDNTYSVSSDGLMVLSPYRKSVYVSHPIDSQLSEDSPSASCHATCSTWEEPKTAEASLPSAFVGYISLADSPTNLTDQIPLWLSRTLLLAESSGATQVVSAIQALETRWQLPGFRMAVVGEFNRGKSTLINRLLGRLVVPVGTLPTTATFTSITAGSEDCMEVRFSKNRRQVRPLEASSWNDLLATDERGRDSNGVAGVQLTLNDSWLRSLDIELIDTPGVGDLNPQRVGLVLDILNQCDAVVLVVNALIPFGMTETAFLQQEVMKRHIERILVVVSHLDTVAAEQRLRVFSHIRQRVAEVSEAIPVLPLHPLNDEATETEILETVKHQIEVMVTKSDRRAWRSQLVARQLSDYLGHLIAMGEGAMAVAILDPTEREQILKQVQEETLTAQFHWRKIRRELEQRCQQRYQKLQEKILAAKSDLMEILEFELSRTQNPKFWWERELSFRLRRELPAISRKSEDFLMNAIARDFEWLHQEVSRAFNLPITLHSGESLVLSSQGLTINHNPDQLNLANLQRYRLLTRIGSSTAMIGGYIFGGPIGIVANLGIALLGEGFLNGTLDKQRGLIAIKLASVIDRVFAEYCQSISQRLQSLYNQLIEDMKCQQSIWEASQKAAIENTHFVSSTEKLWQPIIAKASALKTEILSVLAC